MPSPDSAAAEGQSLAVALMAGGASQAQQASTDGVYRLVAAHSGLVALDLLQAAAQPGALAGQWPWAGSDNERWQIRSLQQWTNIRLGCQIWRIEWVGPDAVAAGTCDL